MTYSEVRAMADTYAGKFCSEFQEGLADAFLAGYMSAGVTFEPESSDNATSDAAKPEGE